MWPHRVYVNVPTMVLAEELRVSQWLVWWVLRDLAKAGIVSLERGRRFNQIAWRPVIFPAAVYRTLTQKYRLSREYISTLSVAAALGKHERMVQYELVRLERAGVVERLGERGGWKPVRSFRQPARMKLLDALVTLYRREGNYLPAQVVAEALGITERHTRRLLADYEARGLVERRGRRGGWKPTRISLWN
jgi:Mn-dependent DtxR family transcriptional regulator